MRPAARAAPSARDRQIVDRPADLRGDRGGDVRWLRGLEVHAPAGPVALQPVPDVEVLLEVVPQREVQERPPGRRQLHRRGQPALDDREVARGQVPVQLGHVRPDLQAVAGGQAGRVDARTGHDDHPQVRHEPLGLGKAAMTRRSR